MKQTARLAMIDLTPEEEAQLEADLKAMTAFGERLTQMKEEEPDEADARICAGAKA